MSFDKKAFIASIQPKTKTVQVDGFGPVLLKQLTLQESDALRVGLSKDDKSSEFGLRLVVASVVDENGERVFADSEIDTLRSTSEAGITKLMDEVMVLNNYRKAPAEKNSETAPSDDSATA